MRSADSRSGWLAGFAALAVALLSAVVIRPALTGTNTVPNPVTCSSP